MLATQPNCEPPTVDPSADRAARQMRALQELAEIGMDLARLLRREAVARAEARSDAADSAAAQPDPAGLDLGLGFSRISRAVRQTLALEARLAEDGLERVRKIETERRAERGRLGAARKATVRRVVERTIDADADHGDVESLLDELDERLDDGREDAHYADRPVGELVASICRGLGVTPDWSLWENEDWAIEEAALRPPGSPFAAPPDTPDPDRPPNAAPWSRPPDKLS